MPGKETCEEKKKVVEDALSLSRLSNSSMCGWNLLQRTAGLVTFVVSGVFLAVRMASSFVTADSAAYRAFRISAALSTATGLLIIPGGLFLQEK